MKNKKIRETAKNYGIMLWQLAEALGIQDSGLSKKLRHELPDQEQAEIINVIQRLAAERQEG